MGSTAQQAGPGDPPGGAWPPCRLRYTLQVCSDGWGFRTGASKAGGFMGTAGESWTVELQQIAWTLRIIKHN